MWNDFPSFLTSHFYIFSFFTPGKQSYFEISEMTTHTPMNRTRDNWWTLDFASAFLSPGVNSRGELVPRPGLAPGTALRAVGSGITKSPFIVFITIILRKMSISSIFEEEILEKCRFWEVQTSGFGLCIIYPRANGAERRSGLQPGARVLIPPGYSHPGKGKH